MRLREVRCTNSWKGRGYGGICGMLLIRVPSTMSLPMDYPIECFCPRCKQRVTATVSGLQLSVAPVK